MTPSVVIELLESWTGLLQEVAEVRLDIGMETKEQERRFDKRQKAIDSIQHLDTSLRTIAKFKHQGWPGFDDSARDLAESLISRGIATCEATVVNDRELIEIAGEKRTSILGQLRRSSQGKGYLELARPGTLRPPVIVDDNA